jgi:hypothetical protein
MGLFKKNIKKDGEKDSDGGEEEKVGQKKVFKKKDFKDLNSTDKKSRREPKKPWGKFERYFVLVVLLTTVLISAYLSLTSTGWDMSRIPKINFKIPEIFREETIIINNEP